MIVREHRRDVLEAARTAAVTHLLVALNTGGYNGRNGSLAGGASRKFWPELAAMTLSLGQVIERTINGLTIVGVACHDCAPNSIRWAVAPAIIALALDRLVLPPGRTLAAVRMGDSATGRARGANPEAVLDVLRTSTRPIEIFSM